MRFIAHRNIHFLHVIGSGFAVKIRAVGQSRVSVGSYRDRRELYRHFGIFVDFDLAGAFLIGKQAEDDLFAFRGLREGIGRVSGPHIRVRTGLHQNNICRLLFLDASEYISLPPVSVALCPGADIHNDLVRIRVCL